MRAAELSRVHDRDNLQALAGSAALLVLTQTRMESLGRPLGEEFCSASMPAHQLDYDRLTALAIDQPSASILDDSIYQSWPSGADLWPIMPPVFCVSPNCFLLPLSPDCQAVMRHLHNRLGQDQQLMVINARDIDQYLESAAQSLRISARAKVPSKLPRMQKSLCSGPSLGEKNISPSSLAM